MRVGARTRSLWEKSDMHYLATGSVSRRASELDAGVALGDAGDFRVMDLLKFAGVVVDVP
jgi:hypothetical protein